MWRREQERRRTVEEPDAVMVRRDTACLIPRRSHRVLMEILEEGLS